MGETVAARRRDIQGLRALAVSAVVAAHLSGWPGGGYLGVDVFFVISGFVITGVLMRDHARWGRVGLRRFYARRARRILPLALVVIAATVAAASWAFSPQRAATTRVDGLWASVFAANWRFAEVGEDYFALGRQPSPLQHYWSLGVEEQFYLVWPLLALLCLGTLARGSPRRGRRILLATAILVAASSLAWATVQVSTDATTAYYSSLTRAWEIGVGCVLALVTTSRPMGSSRAARPLAVLGLLGILASFVLVGPDAGAPFPAAVAPVAATALVLVAGAGTRAMVLPPLTSAPFVWLGDISYAVYLWHFPLLVVLAAVGDSASASARVFVVLATLALAAASHGLLERPVLEAPVVVGRRRGSRAEWGRWWNARRLGVLVGVGALAVTAVSTAAWARLDPSLLGASSPVAALPAPEPEPSAPSPAAPTATTTTAPVAPAPSSSTATSIPPTTSSPSSPRPPRPTPTVARALPLGSTGRALVAGLQEGLAMSSWPGDVNPPLDRFWLTGNSDPAYKACVATVASDPGSCTFGKRNGPEIVVYGDSLGINLLRTVVTTYGADHKVRGLTKLACAVNGVDADFGKDEWAIPCVRHREATIAYVRRAKPEVLVMVENYAWSLKLKSGAKGEAAGREWQAADQAFVRAVSGSVKHVVIVTPSISGVGINDCYRAGGSPRRCVTGIPSWWRTTRDAERRVQGVTFVDTLHWWCVDGRCPIITGIGNTLMKTDYLHASVQYNEILASDLRYRLRAAGVLGR